MSQGTGQFSVLGTGQRNKKEKYVSLWGTQEDP